MKKRSSFSRNLIVWYKKNARDLPWRKTADPYKIWISEVMLQQTTVNAVIPYYERWVKEFPAVWDVARALPEKILKSWQGLGYYSRARNLQRSARIICDEHKGRIPADPERARKLPGFGPYTVGAVLSIAYDQRLPIIDANVRRVMMRQLALKGIADTKQDKKILEFLDQVMPAKQVGIFNQALMELGALVCRNGSPLCLSCPLRPECRAYQKGLQEIIPKPKERIIKDVEVVIALLKKGDTYFIQKRPPKGLFADLWEFPGGKIEPGEAPQEALFREVKEELGIDLDSAQRLFNVQQFYTQFRANLHVWKCVLKSYPATNSTRKWVKFKDLHKYPMPSGSARIVDRLVKSIP